MLLAGANGIPERTAAAADSFAVKNGNLVGSSDVLNTELPPALSAHTLFADPSGEDLYVLGVVGESLTGATATPLGIRYGRRVGRGSDRIVVGPLPLALPAPLQQGAALRGAVARAAAGGTLALGLSTGAEIYFYSASTMAPQNIPPLGTQVSLAQSGLSQPVEKISSMTGLGSKIYAADAVNKLVAQIDLATGTVTACPVDSPVLGLSADSGKVVVTTQTGAAALSDPCAAAPAASVGAAVAEAPSPLTATAPTRSFELSERILELTFPSGAANVRSRRGLIVSTATGGTGAPPTITVANGTCKNTKFYVGDPMGTPVAGNTVALTATAPRLALYAEQTTPGEDCAAVLTATGGTGDALLRIRGEVEGLGANVVLLDRSFSMERSLASVGAAATPEGQRVYALRQAVATMLATITLIPAAGAWAFVPFTTDLQGNLARPATGFATLPAITNPDNPAGMRVRGFASATSDNLDPGGVGDLAQAMRSGLGRLADADRPTYTVVDPRRRLWVITDGASGTRGYGDFAQLAPALARGAVSLQLTAVGGLENDALLPQLAALSGQLSGERLFAPARGQLNVGHTTRGTIENMLSALIQSLVRGRPVSTISRGPLQSGQDLTLQFTLTRDSLNGLPDPWVMFAAAWEDADATVTMTSFGGGFPVNPRCIRGANLILCAATGYDVPYKITLSGSRPGGAPTAAVLRSFASSALGAGEIGFFPSFVRSVNRTGDQVRVQLLLNERGLPLRGAKVTAKVTGPSAGAGTLIAQGAATPDDISALVKQNGDLLPGQAKGELLDPAALPAPRDVAMITLSDAAASGDQEAQDGVYVGQFAALVPGVYVVDLRAEYTSAAGNSDTIEDRIMTQVVVGLDPELTAGSVRRTSVSGGIRLRFTPQDAAKNLLGPGQAAAISFAQGNKLFTPAVEDYLDGSYRADVTGFDTSQPLDLVVPGSRIKIWDPADGGLGCSAAAHAAPMGRTTTIALGLGLAGLLLRRRAIRRKT